MATLIAVYSLLALGILLCFIGKFPGQILAYAGMLVAAFAIKNHFYPTWLLILCGVLVVASIIFNKVVAPKLANKVYEFGKAGRLGTFFGSILSILLIFALENEYVILAVFFIFPYLLAFLFELISQKNAGEAAKRAGGAYTLFAATTLVNLVICLFCAGQVIYGWVGNGPIFKGIKEVASVNREQSIQSGSSYISSVLMPGTYYYEENGPEKGSNNIVDNNTVDDEAPYMKMVDRYEKLVERFISKQKKEGSFDYELYEEVSELGEIINESINSCSSDLNKRFNNLESVFSMAALFGSENEDVADAAEDADDAVADAISEGVDGQVYANAYDGYVNIRSMPSNKGAVVGKFKTGSTGATKLGEIDGWIQIDYEGVVGYVYEKYVSYRPSKPVYLSIDGNWLKGLWTDGTMTYVLSSDGSFTATYPNGQEVKGNWRLEEYSIILQNADGSNKQKLDVDVNHKRIGDLKKK